MYWSGVDYLWIIVMFYQLFLALILTAPIHSRGSIVDKVMRSYISPNLFGWALQKLPILRSIFVLFLVKISLFFLNQDTFTR